MTECACTYQDAMQIPIQAIFELMNGANRLREPS